MADIIIEKTYKNANFSWGAANISNEGDNRNAYLKTVKLADRNDYSLLLAFGRS